MLLPQWHTNTPILCTLAYLLYLLNALTKKLLWQFRIKKLWYLICFQIIAAFFTDN